MKRKVYNFMKNLIKQILFSLFSFKKNVSKGKNVVIGMFSDLQNVNIGDFTYIAGRSKLSNVKIGSYLCIFHHFCINPIVK